MDERRVRPRLLRHGRRLSDGSVVVTTQDDGQVIHAIRYDETFDHVFEELEADQAEATFGKGKSEKNESLEVPDAAEDGTGRRAERLDASHPPGPPLTLSRIFRAVL
jgi:hypothetical protein